MAQNQTQTEQFDPISMSKSLTIMFLSLNGFEVYSVRGFQKGIVHLQGNSNS